MHPERHKVLLTTDAGGAATGYTAVATGRVLQVHYIPDGSTPFDSTADFTLTGEETGQAILAETNVAAAFVHAPRQKVQDQSGADALFAAGGTNLREPIVVANERIKIVIAQGGNTKAGRLDVVVG